MASLKKTKPTLTGRLEQYLRRLHWTVLRPLASRLGGDERSLMLGTGIEVDELREYQPGDDVRQIDWNMMARLGKPYVRQSRVTRALDVWLMMDISPSVDWGTARCLKRDQAVDFAGVTGQIFMRHNHHVGAFLFSSRPNQLIPPSSGRQHLIRLVEAVRSQPREDRPGKTDLKGALAYFERVLPHRSFVVLVSDFLVTDGWQAVMRRFVQRHEVVVVCLRDPREAELPDVGVIVLEDPETGHQRVIDTTSRGLRERFREAADEQSRRLRADLSACGIDCLELSTDADMLPALVRFLEKRKRQASLTRRGQAGGPFAVDKHTPEEVSDAV